MAASAYPAAQSVSAALESYFSRRFAEAQIQNSDDLANKPDSQTIEMIINTAFWASLLREEGYFPKISLAFLPPQQSEQPLVFEKPLPLSPSDLTHLSPAVERPGIHLGVWTNDENTLKIWGTTRTLPQMCFVLEVVGPGLLVVKYRPHQDGAKFVNVMALNGDQIKEIDEDGTKLSDCPALLDSLLKFGLLTTKTDDVNVLIQLATSMRSHGRGGLLLVVPEKSENWRDSIVSPVAYSVTPPFAGLAELMRQSIAERKTQLWREKVDDAVEAIAGLTAVDGATIINDQYELLAFGAKIRRHDKFSQVEQVVVTEPIVGGRSEVIHPVQFGGTRHLSAAQFVQDQPDSIALVASQDGRFTVFAWSPCEQTVHAHRVETLLL